MANNNNNNPYSWFNGPNNGANKPTLKDYLKITLKFSKIFMYVILVLLTVTACGQSFSIRTKNNIGDGLEFYHNSNEVQPFSIVAHYDKSTDKVDGTKDFISNSSGDSYRNLLNDDMKVIEQDGTIAKDGLLTYIHKNYAKAFPSDYNGKNYPVVAVIADQGNNNYKVYGAIRRDSHYYENTANLVAGYTYANDTWTQTNSPLLDDNGKVYVKSPKGDESDDISKKLNTYDLNDKKLLPVKKNTNKYLKTWRPTIGFKGAWHYGPWYGLLVYPLFTISNSLLISFGALGAWAAVLTIIIVVFVLRSIAYSLNFKTMNQSYKMQESQAKIAIINAKYDQYKDNPYMKKKKQQEIMEFYKRENINPLAAIGPMIFMMPLFLSMWRIIGANPIIKTTHIHDLYFSISGASGIFSGHFIYLILLVPTMIVQIIQIILPMWLSKRRQNDASSKVKQSMKKMNRYMYIFAAVMIFMAFTIPAGMGIYWIVSGLFTIGTQFISHHIMIKKQKNRSKS